MNIPDQDPFPLEWELGIWSYIACTLRVPVAED
jgi:hypothetical protein